MITQCSLLVTRAFQGVREGHRTSLGFARMLLFTTMETASITLAGAILIVPAFINGHR